MSCEFGLKMPIHAQKATRYYGRQFLRSRDFKINCNDFSLRKTSNKFMAICAYGEKLLYVLYIFCMYTSM